MTKTPPDRRVHRAPEPAGLVGRPIRLTKLSTPTPGVRVGAEGTIQSVTTVAKGSVLSVQLESGVTAKIVTPFDDYVLIDE